MKGYIQRVLHAISLHAGVSNSGTDSEEDSDRARSRSPSSTTNSAEFGSGPSVDTHSLDIGLLLRRETCRSFHEIIN